MSAARLVSTSPAPDAPAPASEAGAEPTHSAAQTSSSGTASCVTSARRSRLGAVKGAGQA
jgi:hypothetical protein